MAFRGERFSIDLSDEEEQQQQDELKDPFIGDVTERTTSAPVPPSAPRQPPAAGFPAPRKRTTKSAFKQQQTKQRNQQGQQSQQSQGQHEKSSIDAENRQFLQSLSPDRLAHEREELFQSMPQSLLEQFLKRAQLDPPEKQQETAPQKESGPEERVPEEKTSEEGAAEKASKGKEKTAQPTARQERNDIDDKPPTHPPELFPAGTVPPPVHFPRPPPRDNPMPDLDPSAPSFLADLQSHYFPETPHDPSSLAWLDSSNDNDTPQSSAYHAHSTAEAVAPAAVRFSLTGALLPPQTALSLPTTLGLHHHGADPDAAGYTIPEIAVLARSSLPAQRCLAWRILGRLLYRLGKGEFGPPGATLVEGLWETVEREGVVARMLAEASDEGSNKPKDTPSASAGGGIGKHASARAWATEAIWLWRQGGGGDRGLVKEGAIRPR